MSETRARCRTPGTRTRSSCGASARGSSRASWQYAGRARGRRPARLVPHDRRRRHPGPRDPRRRRGAARVHQRLPASRRRARRGLRGEELDPVPLPRVDLRPRRRAARGAARRPRAGVRQERLVAAAGERRHWGPFLFVNPDPQAPAARGAARRAAGDPRPRPRRRQPRVPLAGRVRRGRELEDRRRELPRVLPLRDRASGLQRPGRRAPRPLRARSAPHLRRPVLQVEGDRASAASSTCSTRTPASTSSRARPTCRSGRFTPQRAEPDRALPRLLLRRRTSTRTGGGSSSRSTTRSGARTARSSSRCSAACPPGMLDHGRLLLDAEPLLAAFQGWVRDAALLETGRAGSHRRARARRRAPRSRAARPALRSPSARRRSRPARQPRGHRRQLEQPARDPPRDVLDAARGGSPPPPAPPGSAAPRPRRSRSARPSPSTAIRSSSARGQLERVRPTAATGSQRPLSIRAAVPSSSSSSVICSLASSIIATNRALRGSRSSPRVSVRAKP